MTLRPGLLTIAALLAVSLPADAVAQNAKVIEIPNGMGIHTWFIIVAVGSLLAWSISYSLDLHQERMARRKTREALLEQRQRLLKEIVDLEEQKDSGSVGEGSYRARMKELRGRLANITSRLSPQPPAESS